MLMHRKKLTRDEQQKQTLAASANVARSTSAQITEPVLHVARWAMIVALVSFLVGCTALGFALYATFRG